MLGIVVSAADLSRNTRYLKKEILLKMSRSRGDNAVCTLPLLHTHIAGQAAPPGENVLRNQLTSCASQTTVNMGGKCCRV